MKGKIPNKKHAQYWKERALKAESIAAHYAEALEAACRYSGRDTEFWRELFLKEAQHV
jgi:hypothetical protein